MIPLEDINDAKHVVIVTNDEKLLPVASALYTHLLRLHKKVSFVCENIVIDKRFSFLPWIDKARESVPSSADLKVELDSGDFELYNLFKNNKIDINKKMATALYASLLVQYDGFVGGDADGMVFAVASELMACGADYKECNKFIVKRTTLARLRLKSLMFKKMVLKDGAKEAVFYVSFDDLKSSGASLKDAQEIMKEALYLEYVKKTSLIKQDKNKEI